MAPFDRATAFCERFGLRIPILQAPMAGASPPSLAIAVANAGGMGGCGALTLTPEQIRQWADDVRAGTNGGFQLNLWIPDPPPRRDAEHEATIRAFLARWGPEVPAEAADAPLPDFAAQCRAMLDASPAVISSIMGLYPPEIVAEMKARHIAWFATTTTVAEARAAEAAGADVIVAQGAEAGGHRGAFDADVAELRLVGLFSLLPAIVDAVNVPVVATGGIADARGIVAAFALGASAVEIGTGFLRCPEAKTARAWADAIGRAAPEDTTVTRVFTGRPARGIVNDYLRAATASDAPTPAPWPVQSRLAYPLRTEAAKAGDTSRMTMWAGQSASLARAEPAADLATRLWREAQALVR
jgi:nitronate monooxygenase